MRIPKADIKSVSAEYSFEPTAEHISKLAFILGRTLTQDEKDCLTIKLTGHPVPYTPATYYEPADGGYCEDVQATYEGKDIDSLFENDEAMQERFETELGEDWERQAQDHYAAWEAHLEDLADAAREDARDRSRNPQNYPEQD